MNNVQISEQEEPLDSKESEPFDPNVPAFKIQKFY